MTRRVDAPLDRERLYWCIAVVIGASLPHWLLLPAWMPAVLCAAAAWRIAAERRRWTVPGRAVRIVLALVVLVLVLTRYRTINGIEAGSALLIVMVGLKLVEARTHRDALVLMMIAYFLVFASLLEQQSLFIGLYLLVFVFVTTFGLLQLARRGPLLPPVVSAKLAGRLLLKALPVMIVLFVLFPRLSGPLWALPSSQSQALTGLDGTLSPGDITELAQSDEIAFRVEYDGAAPPVEQHYWRGPVLAAFDGRTWSRRFTGRTADPREIDYVGDAISYRVMLEPGHRGWAFALDLPREWSEPRRLMMTDEYQLVVRNRRDAGVRLDYRAESHTSYRTRAPLGPREHAALTLLPGDANPRTRALAHGWHAAGLRDDEIVAAALDYFRERPFRYTLTPPALGRHAADEFVFDTLQGFCEHYASAFAVMMRAAGIPARVVTGYHGGERNAFADYYIVRQSDAHAWTEVWLDGRGWVRVDPTATIAPERIEQGAASSGRGAAAGRFGGFGLFRNARFAWDALNTYWYGWIIGFSEATQRSLLESLGFFRPTISSMLAAAFVGVAAIVAFLSIVPVLLRRQRPRDPAARWFAVFARRLTRRRVRARAPSETATKFAERAARELPESAAAIRAITRAYLRARYEPDPDSAAQRRLERLVRGFRPVRAARV